MTPRCTPGVWTITDSSQQSSYAATCLPEGEGVLYGYFLWLVLRMRASLSKRTSRQRRITSWCLVVGQSQQDQTVFSWMLILWDCWSSGFGFWYIHPSKFESYIITFTKICHYHHHNHHHLSLSSTQPSPSVTIINTTITVCHLSSSHGISF